MKKSHIIKIILFTSIALVGLIVTQSILIINAINMEEKQRDHRIDMALDDLVDEITMANDTSLFMTQDPKTTTPRRKNTFLEVVDTALLDTRLKKYISNHRLDSNYQFAILKTAGDSLVYTSAADIPPSLKKNAYKKCLSCLWQAETFHLEVYFPSHRKEIFVEMSMLLILSGIFVLIVIFSFLYIIRTIIRQKKISEIKNDFINNMTHEFKTPISTISLASEVLLHSDTDSSIERIKKYSKIIYDENIRMRGQVERVLQVARLDRREFSLKRSEFNLHQLVKETAENLCFEKYEEQTKVNFHLEAENHSLFADEMHIKNVVANLLDNAIKYSSNGAFINIYTRNRNMRA